MRVRTMIAAAGIAVVAFATLATGSASAAPAAPARAPAVSSPVHPMTLNLPYDGTDPAGNGCANTAVTINSATTSTPFGTLYLRWSNGCHTNWGKFVPNGAADQTSVWVYRQADNQYCGDQSGNGCAATFWAAPTAPYSNELYGCNYNTQALVEIWNGGNPQYYYTPFVGGC
jgi:hypothetical protein